MAAYVNLRIKLIKYFFILFSVFSIIFTTNYLIQLRHRARILVTFSASRTTISDPADGPDRSDECAQAEAQDVQQVEAAPHALVHLQHISHRLLRIYPSGE